MYEGIYRMRTEYGAVAYNADVDRVGCGCLMDKLTDLKTQRFHVLVSLLLSARTKDSANAKAIQKLQTHFHGLTVDNICAVKNIDEIDQCISNVGFHHRKAEHLYKTAKQLRDKYDGDIPNTVDELCDLPGIGPKMAHLCMQIAWKQNMGIGVDVHVHRISNLLGWTLNKPCKNPENTRKELESWLPKELWPGVNRLLVGFGQSVCFSRKPKCFQCSINHLCPVGIKVLQQHQTSK